MQLLTAGVIREYVSRSDSRGNISHPQSAFLCRKLSTGAGAVDDIAIPGVQSSGDKLIIFYTCKVCDTRSAKKISKV